MTVKKLSFFRVYEVWKNGRLIDFAVVIKRSPKVETKEDLIKSDIEYLSKQIKGIFKLRLYGFNSWEYYEKEEVFGREIGKTLKDLNRLN